MISIAISLLLYFVFVIVLEVVVYLKILKPVYDLTNEIRDPK